MPIDIDGLSFEELLELNQRVVARLKMLESMQTHIEMMRFNPGQRVSFAHGGGRLMGTLVKYNRKTVTVVTDNGQRWNITPPAVSGEGCRHRRAATTDRQEEKATQIIQVGAIAVWNGRLRRDDGCIAAPVSREHGVTTAIGASSATDIESGAGGVGRLESEPWPAAARCKRGAAAGRVTVLPSGKQAVAKGARAWPEGG